MSSKMVDFARSKWKDSRLTFEVLDISTKSNPFLVFDAEVEEAGGFNKILSFFCLQWVKDRRRMLNNIHKLLSPGGYAYLLLVVRSGVYNVWDKLAKQEKWQPFLKGIQTPLNDYIYMDNYEKVFCEAAEDVGFQVIAKNVTERKDAFTTKTDTDEEKIMRLRTVDPFVRLIPEPQKMEYLFDLLDIVKREVSPKGATDYTALIVLLKKNV